MKKNVGLLDRIIRFIVAIILGYLYFAGIVTGTVGIIVLIIGLIMLFTALVGYCALYAPFGINTCSKNKQAEKNED